MPIPFSAVIQFLFLDSFLVFLRICFKPGESFLYNYWISALCYTLPLFQPHLETTQDPHHLPLNILLFSLPPPYIYLFFFNPNQISPYNRFFSHLISSVCSDPVPSFYPAGQLLQWTGMMEPIASLCLPGGCGE